MSKITERNLVVGLDIGTSKVCALVTSPDPSNNTLKILGIGIAESEGLNRGVVVNIEKTIKSIRRVIEQAEEQSGNLGHWFAISFDEIEQLNGNKYNEEIFEEPEIDEFLKGLNKPKSREYYEPCSNSAIIIRMLTNLIASFQQSGSAERVKELVELRDLFDIKF